ncbi:hypothetical protein AD09_0213 [Escherichia coli 1-176-05_S4_C2]|nr:hypothetical protein HMPREF9543_02037 [Escherichia coli MS 146-1]EGW98455.1 hypothetical protein ECSTECEH250_0316 [Escherichia coli STEC_EH250]EHV63127.1 hypothetical protein ECDEC6A_0351 [Escherichia coli DEC6A]EHV65086.1 hypothetical protein ECDEC6B_0348 [Escherichia coli DEC6B]EHV77617.1 hypothetical protein ECDEC6D_0325 [Escherichia coli DEC6D]EHV79868.1 hypothetical protein ECDEC6E_0234 [Escherichia coli DEC6E]EMZ88901.1 hypothetical protein EC2722950_0272 [Escherichia coli 2722950]E
MPVKSGVKMGILKFRKPGAGRRMRRTYGHKHKNMCELVGLIRRDSVASGTVHRTPDAA